MKSVSQASSASEEQAKGLQELSEAIEEIAALADELQSN
jgi:methyl-accepting chemotaxis protein